MTTTAILPATGVNGQEVLDRYGNRWVYDDETGGWISKGVVSAPVTVSEDQNGLITPDIFSQLSKLRQYVNSGVDLTPLKLLPGRTGYWYYFRTSDKMYRFRPEGNDVLRIEVEKGRFYQLLLKNVCPGKRGPKGATGETGEAGASGSPELCFAPSAIVGDRIDFAIFTPTPLVVGGAVHLPANHVPEISVRLHKVTNLAPTTSHFDDQLHAAAVYYRKYDVNKVVTPSLQRTRDFLRDRSLGVVKQDASLCNISLSKALIITNLQEVAEEPAVTIEISPVDTNNVVLTIGDESLGIDEIRTVDSIKFDPTTNIVCGSIFLQPGSVWPSDWCIRSRQKGPDGDKGEPGDCKVRIVECTLDDTNMLATCPLVNVRVDCDRDILYTLCSPILDEYCADLVSLAPDSGTLANTSALKSVFASSQMVLDECKRINRFEMELEVDELPDLELIQWAPQPGCFTQRHYDRYKFDWVPLTDVPECDSTAQWFSPTEVRPGKYPHPLVIAPEPPPDECCADDFFYCPNVQDAPCPPLECTDGVYVIECNGCVPTVVHQLVYMNYCDETYNSTDEFVWDGLAWIRQFEFVGQNITVRITKDPWRVVVGGGCFPVKDATIVLGDGCEFSWSISWTAEELSGCPDCGSLQTLAVGAKSLGVKSSSVMRGRF